ncbi:MAG: Type 1 glutamine amidotransferase-like domain-containing protein [Candidatus Aenigmarchaeota archaeon]|nr:Type 1 glutamine amidotransferase-like domain-containing protein [Candidatus Aenigmarchaeota archaeon]
MKNYLEGGNNMKTGVGKTLDRKILKEVKEPVIFVLHWTSRDVEKLKHYRKIMKKYFTNLGAKKILFSYFDDSYEDIKQKIEKSNMIYFPGGEPDLLYKTIKKKGITKLLKSFDGIIFGTSAGALIQCKRYAIIKEQGGRKKTKLETGIGFVDIIVEVHYGNKNPNLSPPKTDEELKKLSKRTNKKIYAICDAAAIEVSNSHYKYHGKIYCFENGSRRSVN